MTTAFEKESFGRYQLQEKLGQGGMGVVYRAFDTVLERVVALKLVLTHEGLEPELRERFFREARAAGHLSHKNIVTVYDLGEHEGQPYLAMEYLDGEDLQKRLARPERMSLRRKIELAIDICEGVEFAHAHGVIHRDLKPANIYITESGGAKILDFGLARLITSQLTQSNMLMGTLNYMSPEQVRGERVDQRSDVFSIGVVLYELLGGRKAFQGDSVASTLFKILQEPPEPLIKIDAALPAELNAIVERAMGKLRDERYPDVGSMRNALEAYRDRLLASGSVTPIPSQVPPGSSPPLAVPVTARSRRGLPASVLVLGAAALMLVLGAAWFMKSRTAAPPAPPKSEQAAARPQDAIGVRLRDAHRALDARQFPAALAAADAVLVLEPANADAQRVRASARRGAVDDAVARATRHLQNGETSDAIKAAGEALAFAPDNEEARRILENAAARTGASDADAARRRMMDGRAAAETAGAARLATAAFGKAGRAAQDAERLFKARRFGDAASRFYEAGGLYHAAETAARANAAASATPAAPPARTRAGNAAEQQPPTAAAPSATPPPPPPPSSGAPVTASAPQPTIPVPTPPPAATPSPPPAAVESGPTAEERISELLGHYKQALEARDLDQLKRWWPSLGGSAETAIRQEFQHASRISVGIEEPHVTVTGNSGRITFLRRYSLVTVEGQPLQSTTRATMDVRRAGSTWVIDSLRFTPQ